MDAREHKIHVSDGAGDVSALAARPRDAWAGYVFAHGAGAGMQHPFLEQMAGLLFDAGVATLRYQFPYMEKRHVPGSTTGRGTHRGRGGDGGVERVGRTPLFAGGKSLADA
jgi:predicted alpha/beta-hydrolase family hydrolase